MVFNSQANMQLQLQLSRVEGMLGERLKLVIAEE